jgi:STE24 endopeptidase
MLTFSAETQTYGRAKARYSFVRSCFDVAKSLATVYFNLFPQVWSVAGFILPRFLPARFQGEITQSLVFIFLFNYIDLIYGLPFSYYHTFVLEEKFGFNKTTLNTWIKDIVKGQALTLAFGVPIGSAFLKIIQMTGQSFFYYLWVFMLVIQVGAMTIYPIWIMPLFNKFTPLEPGPLKERIDALAAKLKFPLSELLVIDGSKRSSHSNAFFTGLPWKKRIVIYDTLMQKSTDQEVEAVLAHELGHWKRGHTTRLLMISQVQTFYVFALFSAFIENSSLFHSFGFDHEKPIIIGFLLYSAVSSCTEPLLSLAMHMLTRAYEYEAGQ